MKDLNYRIKQYQERLISFKELKVLTGNNDLYVVYGKVYIYGSTN